MSPTKRGPAVLPTAAQEQMTLKSSEPTLGLGKRQACESGILKAIGNVTFERLGNGRFCVRHPVQGGAEFGAKQEKEAREYFQSVARAEKGYPSGFDPCAKQSTPERAYGGQGEAFNARAVRRLCKDDVPLSDFLDCCVIEMSKLLAFVDQADCDQAERDRIKQRLLHWQAEQRLLATGKEARSK